MSSFSDLLNSFRTNALTEREKGNNFESLVKLYLQKEPLYGDLYSQVWLWEEWRQYWKEQGHHDPGGDTGIDLVARTRSTDEYHAIQAKFYAEDSKLYKQQIDSFFTASGKKPFSHRLIVVTTDKISVNVEAAFEDQHIPVSQIALSDLENSKIDWESYLLHPQTVKLHKKNVARPYQEEAIKDVIRGLQMADRGKLIMACGSGKTLTALRLVERMVGKGGRVLFLVPSLNLLSQTLSAWTQEAELLLHSYAVCSDNKVGKKHSENDDFQMLVHELQYPATTNAKSLGREYARRADDEHLNVVFSTYHSIDVLAEAQKHYNLPEFDMIICDEAHRTTGATFAGDDDSAFVRVHDQEFIQGKKRLYMTATPRVYGTMAKATAERDSVILYSMDNEDYFGKTLHTLTFSAAVNDLKILCDYKVMVLTISEDHISRSLQRLLADANNSLNVNDAAKIVGCWRALSKMDSKEDLALDPNPMRRAVAFAQVIEINKGARTHKVSSKNIAAMFADVVGDYRAELLKENPDKIEAISELLCEADHVDGGMNANEKNAKIAWLKEPVPENTCRILSNVRCLSEGVDVPALDAVLFLTPRNSPVDVVQSVGRVMRKPKDGIKKLGYVILPVVIPSGVSPEAALNDNKTYRVVWEVLQALRSHDDRFDAMINKMDLGIQEKSKMEVIAITDKIVAKSKKTDKPGAKGKGGLIGKPATGNPAGQDKIQTHLHFDIGEIERAIVAKVVQKCGNRLYWDEWAQDIGRIAQTHISRITALLNKPENVHEIAAFESFIKELRDDLNDDISREEAIEMLAQHLITKPVFEALFEGYSFTSHNPVSMAMQKVLDVLEGHHLEKETDTLEKFYDSVKMRASGITEVRAKQRIIKELYEKFFNNAFPRMTERLGIVYTPVEVVDFIIHSVNDVLQEDFGQHLGSRGVHILDPFTGTGTFITRLLQSGLISKEELAYKYQNEIHANEIVLLAYYIAAINIEQVYHDLVGGDYVPFNGICLTDTFALHSHEDMLDEFMPDNSARLKRQRKLDIRVIMSNPPYSAGQTSANDNNANQGYPQLDARIRNTYAEHSTATNKNALYDSYIRAIRWASDRIGNSGVIGFVSNAGWVEANTADGLRKCLAEEFSSIYVFHLRGNARTSGELRRREKDNVFGQGTRTPIAITLLVKNPQAKEQGKIVLHDIGDYLSQGKKLALIEEFKSIHGITAANGWQVTTPDKHHDWIKQRDDSFDEYISIGDKKDKDSVAVFENYSSGVKTNRDAWCYNFSREELAANMSRMVQCYNIEVERYKKACDGLSKEKWPAVDGFVNTNASKISWSSGLKNDLERHICHSFHDKAIMSGVYRPFAKSWVYYSKTMNERTYQMPRIFPDNTVKNRVICVTGRGSTLEFSAHITDTLPDLEMVSKGQCFPLKLYEPIADDVEKINKPVELFATEPKPESDKKYTLRDGITDAGLQHFQEVYPCEEISKEDLFYYIYGLLHSEDYRTQYADNLSKELPRIPAVNTADDFWAFSQAGRRLAELHIGYEYVEPYPVQYEGGAVNLGALSPEDLYVTQMKFAKGSDEEKWDKTTVIYNHKITMTGIPLEAYDYVVNGKPALEWVMERQAVTTHKESGIVNDANLWATETMNDPAYPLKLFQRVITVSLETMKIVRGLPRI